MSKLIANWPLVKIHSPFQFLLLTIIISFFKYCERTNHQLLSFNCRIGKTVYKNNKDCAKTRVLTQSPILITTLNFSIPYSILALFPLTLTNLQRRLSGFVSKKTVHLAFFQDLHSSSPV